jgi:two-component system CheB/CheR fusion protein
MSKRTKTSLKQEVQSPAEGTAAASVEVPVERDAAVSFPIVGIGASAGGLAAIEAFFAAIAPDTESGMAFVLVQHLDPDHKSILLDLVKRYTRMQVYKVEDGMEVQPNCTYIIPPNRDMAFLHGKLHLLEPAAPRGLRLPIDFFFRSLAQDRGERAICVVLSGTGTDGTLGLKAIKGEGGMAMVQAPESAAYDGMPRSAIATGLVDYVLPPDKMPEQLIAYVRHTFGRTPRLAIAPAPKTGDPLQKVFILLRTQTGHDFTHYKQNTIHRRIEKRMAVTQIDHLEDYIRYLQQNPLEVETLFRELLIGVTNFFRDPEAFEVLKEHVIRRLLAGKSPGRPVRVWVPACSTGEEAYSLAILLQEHADYLKQNFEIQIFATDIDAEAIEKARTGLYPDSIAADVSSERLGRFFTHDDSTYRVRKTIRDMVVFAKQDVLKDPPFSKIDLISCRNLLIYMGAELQKKLVPLFHYALNQNGYLFLGNSETIGEFLQLFAVVDKKWRLYQRKGVVAPRSAIAPFAPALVEDVAASRAIQPGKREARVGVRDLAERALLEDAPACAVINTEFEVLYIHGHTGRYLEPAQGEGNLNLLHMAREGLKLELSTAVRKVIAQQVTVRYEGLQVKANGDASVVNLVVRPVTKPDSARGLILVLFEDVTPETRPEAQIVQEPITDKEQRIADLERELRTKQEYLQTTIEELETSNEELKSSNEELQSSNEELQSTNEELETSKEELQSVNEELVTVNTELQNKIDELSQANNDMNNLLAGTGIGTIFVDHQLHILRFTPAATQIINLIRTDVGRPVSDIVYRLGGYVRLVEDIRAVLDTLIPREAEVQTREKQWYLMRILPYRTLENVIEGAVLSFVEITRQKELQEQLQELTRVAQGAREYAEHMVDTIHEPLLVLNADIKVVAASRSFYEFFQVVPEETIGRLLYDLGNQQWNIPEMRRLLEEILPQETSLRGFEVTHEFQAIGRHTMLLNARQILQKAGKERLILLAIEDVTKH